MPETVPEQISWQIDWQIGIEVELLAPKGRSRYDLARAIAEAQGGTAHSYFHPQSEPSKVPGAPIFENLTLGFEAVTAEGVLLARCVDDLTLQLDLDKKQLAKKETGWYRIVSDDMRFLRLIMQHAQASTPLDEVLEPVAQLFGSTLAHSPDGMVRLSDDRGASIAIAAPLPGERERPCELITPPIATAHHERLQTLLSSAQALGFYAPVEGATHIHFDATRLCSAPVLANLVAALWVHGAALRQLVGTNPRCTRLGKWPASLHELVQSPGFVQLPWDEVLIRLGTLKLSKYCDFNLINLLYGYPDKHTFEVRIFPVWMQAETILQAAGLFSAILHWALDTDPEQGIKTVPPDLGGLLRVLPLDNTLRAHWVDQLADKG